MTAIKILHIKSVKVNAYYKMSAVQITKYSFIFRINTFDNICVGTEINHTL